MKKIMPELPLGDVTGGIAHYRDVLGSQINYQQHRSDGTAGMFLVDGELNPIHRKRADV